MKSYSLSFYYILCIFNSHFSDNLLSLSRQTDNVVILIITKLGDRCEDAIEVCAHGVYTRSHSWCVYTRSCSWCIHKVKLMLYTQGRAHGVYTRSHSWCIHKVVLMVYTQGRAYAVYTRGGCHHHLAQL